MNYEGQAVSLAAGINGGPLATAFSVLTLFMLMQLTGRINWTEAFAKPAVKLPPSQ